MAKLSKEEKMKIEQQMKTESNRFSTWVGIRPSTMQSKTAKYNKKISRRENRRICKNY